MYFRDPWEDGETDYLHEVFYDDDARSVAESEELAWLIEEYEKGDFADQGILFDEFLENR